MKYLSKNIFYTYIKQVCVIPKFPTNCLTDCFFLNSKIVLILYQLLRFQIKILCVWIAFKLHQKTSSDQDTNIKNKALFLA